MSTPDLATRLLLATDETAGGEAHTLARRLDEENARRQQQEGSIFVEARRAVESNPDIGAHGILVVSGSGWHRGVIGIVASKLVETFYRPAIVLSSDGDVAYGSGRSIPGFDLLAALERCAELVIRYGGHRQAAGVTLEASRINELRARLTRYADALLGPDDLTPRLRIDGPLRLGLISGAVVEDIRRFEPFGSGNTRPIFHTSEAVIVDGPHRLKERHLKMAVRQDGRVFRAVAWRAAERAAFLDAHRDRLDVAFSVVENHYRGDTFVELSIADVREGR